MTADGTLPSGEQVAKCCGGCQPYPHGVAWEDRLNIICLCGQVCTAVMGKSPARIMGATSDEYVRKPAAQAFAQHLLDVRRALSANSEGGQR